MTLTATCKRAGLLDADGRITDARRFLNSDECPNPWRGTGDRGKILAEVGKPCVKLVTAAREHTSLDVLVGLDGWIGAAHLIFKGEYIQRQMIPDKEKVPNSKVSAVFLKFTKDLFGCIITIHPMKSTTRMCTWAA